MLKSSAPSTECPSCKKDGFQITDARFCSYCGTPRAQKEKEVAPVGEEGDLDALQEGLSTMADPTANREILDKTLEDFENFFSEDLAGNEEGAGGAGEESSGGVGEKNNGEAEKSAPAPSGAAVAAAATQDAGPSSAVGKAPAAQNSTGSKKAPARPHAGAFHVDRNPYLCLYIFTFVGKRDAQEPKRFTNEF